MHFEIIIRIRSQMLSDVNIKSFCIFDIHLIHVTVEFILLCLKCSCTIYTTISDVMDFTKARPYKGIMTAIDFKKAFDSIN